MKDPLFNLNLNKSPSDKYLEKLNLFENNSDINDYVTLKSPKVAKSQPTENSFTAKVDIFISKHV